VGRGALELCGPIARKATGFKPLPLNINPGFKTCRFKFNLRRYSGDVPVLPQGGGLYKLTGGLYKLTHSLKAPGFNACN
jgi:hypothetical protein